MNYKVDSVENYANTKGWLCGHFFPEDSIQKSSDLEVKCDVLNPGDTHPPHYHPHGMEICVVVKGSLRWQLDEEEIILKEGEFVILKNNVVEAVLEVYEPTTVIIARTPSVPNNKIEKIS